MKNNIYLYLILISLLVGGFSGFVGYDHFKKAEKVRRRAETIAQNIDIRKEELRKKEIELVDLEFERREKQMTVREFSRAILEQQEVQKSYQKLEEHLSASVKRQKMMFIVNQEGVSEMQDQLVEDTTSTERQVENMRAMFDLEKGRLGTREEFLKQESRKDQQEHARKIGQLDTEIGNADFELQRINSLNPSEVKEPWPVGKVLDFYSPLNKVVINLGSTDGIRQNFKFMLFSNLPGLGRDYKGMVVIKDVDELVSTGTMLMAKRESLDPVAGDSIGSITYRKDELTFYLGGDFGRTRPHAPRYKYYKSEYVEFLKYSGNRVVDELDANVDFFVMGALADNEVPLATSLGVSIIPIDLLTPYLGE